MTNVVERLERAVKQDPSLRPVAEAYLKVLREVAATSQTTGQSATPGTTNHSTNLKRWLTPRTSTKPRFDTEWVVSLVQQLAAAQSPDEVLALREKFDSFFEPSTKKKWVKHFGRRKR